MATSIRFDQYLIAFVLDPLVNQELPEHRFSEDIVPSDHRNLEGETLCSNVSNSMYILGHINTVYPKNECYRYT